MGCLDFPSLAKSENLSYLRVALIAYGFACFFRRSNRNIRAGMCGTCSLFSPVTSIVLRGTRRSLSFVSQSLDLPCSCETTVLANGLFDSGTR